MLLAAGQVAAKHKKVMTPQELHALAEKRIKTFKLPPKFDMKVWANSSQPTNPSSFYFDSRGRLMVCEIHRWWFGVDDIRGRRYMLFDDLQNQTTADRLKMFKKHSDKHPMSWYTAKADQIRLLEDTNGDGRADSSKVFAGGFNDALDGPGIGVIERDGKVYYTNIPHLWMLEDKDNDGVAEKRTSLQEGFGTRMSFSGHDMHGLIWGPDGKLYWSLGDRGYSIKTKEGKTFHGPNRGGVFRCNPDGSDIELFYLNLRNPQELAFDDYGNLFTADNDGDGGDVERINYLVEGGDSGWSAGHQAIMSFARDYKLRSLQYSGSKKLPNPWMTEDMWKVRQPHQPAFILPGIGQINGGPAGFCFNPSNSLGQEYDDNFFVIYYKGSPTRSYISRFKVEEEGASYKMINRQEFLRGINAVDIDFGPDGRLYLSEFNYNGWGNQNVGNIYAMSIPKELAKAEVKENKKILTADFAKKSLPELKTLLARDHQQVRLRSQYEIAKRGAAGRKLFTACAFDTKAAIFTRMHGIWGLGQMAHGGKKIDFSSLQKLLTDANDQVRIQTARVLGDHKVKSAVPALIQSLKDKHLRVAMYAAIGLGRIAATEAVPQLLAVLERNADKDLWLRHGVVMALAGIDKKAWTGAIKHENVSIRMGALLALRKSEDAQLASFLNDPVQKIRYEAIRAINDLHIVAVQKQLAAELEKYLPGKSFAAPKSRIDAFMHHRIINANFYQANIASAQRLMAYASNAAVPERLRIEALCALEGWNDKHPIDTTTGLPHPLAKNRVDIQAPLHAGFKEFFVPAKGKVLAQGT